MYLEDALVTSELIRQLDLEIKVSGVVQVIHWEEVGAGAYGKETESV